MATHGCVGRRVRADKQRREVTFIAAGTTPALISTGRSLAKLDDRPIRADNPTCERAHRAVRRG